MIFLWDNFLCLVVPLWSPSVNCRAVAKSFPWELKQPCKDLLSNSLFLLVFSYFTSSNFLLSFFHWWALCSLKKQEDVRKMTLISCKMDNQLEITQYKYLSFKGGDDGLKYNWRVTSVWAQHAIVVDLHTFSTDNWDILAYILFANIQYTHCL